jgi:SnoaL-like protein
LRASPRAVSASHDSCVERHIEGEEMNRVFLVVCGVVGVALAAAAQGREPGNAMHGGSTPGSEARLQKAEDLEAIRAIPSCYGYGHDLIFKHLGGDHADAVDALRRCHVDNLTTNVFLFDETSPATQLHSIGELIAFVESFAKDQGYSSARNVPGNVQVEFTGPATARVQSSTVAPHFITIGPHSPAADFVEARYVDNVVRGSDGVWRAVEFELVVQQIWRGVGTFPFAKP